jgi:hypothetical protein
VLQLCLYADLVEAVQGKRPEFGYVVAPWSDYEPQRFRKFQGQEAPVVIYSMTTSSWADAPRGMEFLYSLNRLNVATSRAKCVCILVASPTVFEVQSERRGKCSWPVSQRGRPPSPFRADTLRRWLRCRLRCGDGWCGRDHHRSGTAATLEY